MHQRSGSICGLQTALSQSHIFQIRLLGFIWKVTIFPSSLHCLLILYCTLVRSALKHASVLWSFFTYTNASTLKCTQRKFVSLCYLLFCGRLRMRKATISFVMYVRPSAWNNSAPTRGIFMKFDVMISKKNPENSSFSKIGQE